MAASDSPVVVRAAAAGQQWAVKLQQKGWRSLSKMQKATARAHGIGVAPPATVIPKTNRLLRGNPTNARRGPEDPGNAAKSMTITKPEYLGEIGSDTEVRVYKLDPRSVGSFPHVSVHALGYNKYKFTQFRVRYSPKVATSESGIIIAYSSDSSDPVPRTKNDLYNMGTKFEGAAHKPLLASIPIDKSTKYLRDCATESAKEVDSGAIYIMVDGPVNGRLGELFFEFCIVLSELTFDQKFTQLITGNTTAAGPEYCKVVQTANTLTLTFNAAGKYLLSSCSSLLESIGRHGLLEAERVQVDSAEKSSCLVEVNTDKPFARVVYTFQSRERMTFRGYVSRL